MLKRIKPVHSSFGNYKLNSASESWFEFCIPKCITTASLVKVGPINKNVQTQS